LDLFLKNISLLQIADQNRVRLHAQLDLPRSPGNSLQNLIIFLSHSWK
jgi:hypothetical protein